MGPRLTIAALTVMLASAIGLYAVKYDAKQIDDRVRKLTVKVADAEAAIAVLTAERANLTRPELIERQTRVHLKLQPLKPGQFATIAELPWREDVTGASPVPAP